MTPEVILGDSTKHAEAQARVRALGRGLEVSGLREDPTEASEHNSAPICSQPYTQHGYVLVGSRSFVQLGFCFQEASLPWAVVIDSNRSTNRKRKSWQSAGTKCR